MIEFHVPSLVETKSGEKVKSRASRAEVFLSLDYPRRPPFCRMLNPVFHPNIDPTKICIGDHWTAGQSLAQLIVQIGEIHILILVRSSLAVGISGTK